MVDKPVILVTGAARRIGREIISYLHSKSCRVVIHYNHSATEAKELAMQFNEQVANSAFLLQGDLRHVEEFSQWMQQIMDHWGRLDGLVNNGSSFFPTPIGHAESAHWDNLFASNAKGPFFLSQAAQPFLEKTNGSIVNISDVHGERPLGKYPIYSIAKAAMNMMTKALARELAPGIRVNGVAPGNILWPERENELSVEQQQQLLRKVPLQRKGSPQQIAKAVHFLLLEAEYTTGEILRVDGGKGL